MLFRSKDLDATIMRTPGQLFQQRGTDSVSNLYNIKVANKTVQEVPLELRLEGISGRIDIVGLHPYIDVKQEGQGSGSFFVVLPRKSIHRRKEDLKIALYAGARKVDVIKTSFLGPVEY